jgi:hypothetical protein
MRTGMLVLASVSTGCAEPAMMTIIEPPMLFVQTFDLRAEPTSGVDLWQDLLSAPNVPISQVEMTRFFGDVDEAPTGTLALPFWYDEARSREVTVLVPRCTEGSSEIGAQELDYILRGQTPAGVFGTLTETCHYRDGFVLVGEPRNVTF